MSDISPEEVADVAAEVAEEIVEAAPFPIGVLIGGLFAGASAGFAAGYFFCRKKLDAKYMAIANELAEAEISQMREHYAAKVVAVEGSATKPNLEALVRDKGYSASEDPEFSTEPPMAVDPPTSVVEAAEEKAAEDAPAQKLDPTPEEHVREMEERAAAQRIFAQDEPQPESGWDYHNERSRRSPMRPYIIHVDERQDMPSYDEETYTYYEADDVVCNEVDDALGPPDRERLIGEAHLDKFGHGSGDPNIVYIRNDQAKVVIELVRSPNAYVTEVHGLQHSDPTYPRRRKVRFDDEQ